MGATCSNIAVVETKIDAVAQDIATLVGDLHNLRVVVASLPQTSAVVADVNKIKSDVSK